MSQPQIDLLPESIRASCQAGVRTGQYIASVAAGILIVIVAATHTQFERQRVSEQLAETKKQANYVLGLEAEAAELQYRLEQATEFIELQKRVAWPMEIGAILATMINRMSSTITLDSIDMNAGARRSGRSPRHRGMDDAGESRMLRGEISGFASSDDEIAEFIAGLQKLKPFDEVSLDFSRGRAVWGMPAREFRMSFRIHFDAEYDVEHLTVMSSEEVRDVQ